MESTLIVPLFQQLLRIKSSILSPSLRPNLVKESMVLMSGSLRHILTSSQLLSPISVISPFPLAVHVPDKLTISKVLPIYKSDDKTKFTNNRPISILPCFSHILEILSIKVLWSDLIKSNILNNHQYGFKSKHSTFMAILELTNQIFKAFERNSLSMCWDHSFFSYTIVISLHPPPYFLLQPI